MDGALPVELVRYFPKMEEVDYNTVNITIDNHLDHWTLIPGRKEIIMRFRLKTGQQCEIRRFDD